LSFAKGKKGNRVERRKDNKFVEYRVWIRIEVKTKIKILSLKQLVQRKLDYPHISHSR
jgi:hypothetical protein